MLEPLQRDERRRRLVHVPDRRFEAERRQRAHRARAQQHRPSRAAVRVVVERRRRQLAIPGRVLGQIRVEQVQRDASRPHLPCVNADVTAGQPHGQRAAASVGAQRGPDRRVRPIEVLVRFLLPAFAGEPLMRVAARIHQPDADERHAEVARFLAVIAGDDAEAGAVERQRLVEGELRTHAGDRLRDTRHAPGPPRARARANDVQRGDGRVVQPQELRIARGMIETLGFDQMQQQHRVVIGEPPQRIVEIPENLARLRVPAPPQVVGQLVEAANPGRQGRERDVPVHVGRRNYQPQS